MKCTLGHLFGTLMALWASKKHPREAKCNLNGSQKSPHGGQRVPREPKWSPKGPQRAQMEPKSAQKGAKRAPKDPPKVGKVARPLIFLKMLIFERRYRCKWTST